MPTGKLSPPSASAPAVGRATSGRPRYGDRLVGFGSEPLVVFATAGGSRRGYYCRPQADTDAARAVFVPAETLAGFALDPSSRVWTAP